MSQNYTPTEWVDNRTVGTASVMNNMERGINGAHDRIDGFDSQIKNIEDEIKNIGNTTAGLTNTAKTLLISILRNAMFNSDQSENITLLADELGVGDSGETTQYTISNSLSNATTSNNATLINANTSYSTTITPNDGYTLNTVTVTMGGTDITSSVYSNGVITIASVTGNIVITASATATSSGEIACTGITLNNNTLNINKTESTSRFNTDSYVAKATPDALNNDIYFGCFTEFYPVNTGDVVTLEMNDSVPNGLIAITTDTPRASEGVQHIRVWDNREATNTYTILEGQKYITFRLQPTWETYLVDIKINGVSILNVSETPSTTYQLTATVTPSNTTDEITWSVSPSGICSVENGVITPITVGTCIVTATCGSQSATCNVTVNSSSGGSTPTPTTYTITNNLSNCSTNNSNTSVNSGYAYMSTITANSGYTMSSIVVTMGGTNITSTAVSGNSINISSVTGNVVITASATKNSTGNPTVPTLSYTSTDVPQIINYYYPAKRKVSTSETTIPIYFSDYYQREYYYEDTSLRFNLRVDVDGNVKWINNLPAGDYDVSLGVLPVGEHYFSLEVTQVGAKTAVGNDLRSQRLFNKILIVESMDIPASETYTVKSSDLSNYNITLGLTSSATETQMTNNRNGMTNMFKALHKQGYRKIIMPANSVIRINCVGAETKPSGTGWDRWSSQKAINIPTNTTVDLNGSTIKLHPYDDRQYDNVGAVANFMVVMNDCVDSHLINGTLEGDWEERKASNFYQGSNGLDNGNGEHAGCICMFGGKYNTVDNLTVTNITGYSCQNEKSMKDVVFTNMCYHWGPNKGCWLNGNNTDMVNGVATTTTEARLTSDYVDLADVLPYGEFAPGRLFTGFPVCRYYETLCSFFDANKNFIDSFIAYQARHVRIPNGAKYIRVTLNGQWQDLANDNGYTNNPDFMLVSPYQSEYSEWNNLHFVDNRTCCNPNRFRNLRVYKCDFTRVGNNITPVALDAEDGTSTMQDLYVEECNMIERGEGQTGDVLFIAGLNMVMQNNLNLSFKTGGGVVGLTVRNNTLGQYGSLVKKGWKTRNTYRVYNNIAQDGTMIGIEQEGMGDDQDKDALLMIKNCTPMAYTYGANKNDVLMRGVRIKDCDDAQLGDWGHLYNCTCYINSNKVSNANKTGSATFNDCTITRKTSGGNGNTAIVPFGSGKDNMGTYTDCIFNFPGVSSTSFKSDGTGTFTKGQFNNCTFKTPMILELVNVNNMGDIKFNNCKFEANLTLKLTDTKVQFNGCTFNGITYENNGQANTQIN